MTALLRCQSRVFAVVLSMLGCSSSGGDAPGTSTASASTPEVAAAGTATSGAGGARPAQANPGAGGRGVSTSVAQDAGVRPSLAGNGGTSASAAAGSGVASAGTPAAVGATVSVASGGSGGGALAAGMGASVAGAAGASASPPSGENSVAYIGCSMAYNIGTGYKRVGGKVMWNSDSYQTSAMVVQNWTDPQSASWRLFDQKLSAIGGKDKVKAIMVQICIFSSRATEEELKSMIKAARMHVNPGTHVYLVGQPQYEAGHECTLAGTGGAKWTDDQAKALAADASVNENLTYLGQFKLDSTKQEVMGDSCHASSPTGENQLGEQAKAFFGG